MSGRLGAVATLLTVALVASGATRTPDPPRQDPIDFLERLVGEWTVVTHVTLGPGQDPVRLESREVARLLGGRWLIAEGTGTTPDDRPVETVFTLGYDPGDERFVGTWISSLQGHLWQYTGELDPSETVLTLDTEGPVRGNPNVTTRYREIVELENGDRRVTRSMIMGPDGEWFEFSRAEYRRSVPRVPHTPSSSDASPSPVAEPPDHRPAKRGPPVVSPTSPKAASAATPPPRAVQAPPKRGAPPVWRRRGRGLEWAIRGTQGGQSADAPPLPASRGLASPRRYQSNPWASGPGEAPPAPPPTVRAAIIEPR